MFEDFRWRTPVETDPTRALIWLIGLPGQFLGGEDGNKAKCGRTDREQHKDVAQNNFETHHFLKGGAFAG